MKLADSPSKKAQKTVFLKKNDSTRTFILAHFSGNGKSIMLVKMVKELDLPLLAFFPRKQKKTKIW